MPYTNKTARYEQIVRRRWLRGPLALWQLAAAVAAMVPVVWFLDVTYNRVADGRRVDVRHRVLAPNQALRAPTWGWPSSRLVTRWCPERTCFGGNG